MGLVVYHIAGQSPQNDTDAALIVVVVVRLAFRFWRQRINAMLPTNVDVPAKGKDAIAGLGKVHPTGWVLLLVIVIVGVVLQVFGRGPNERQFSCRAKGDADGNVLTLGTAGIEGGAVVMEGLDGRIGKMWE